MNFTLDNLSTSPLKIVLPILFYNHQLLGRTLPDLDILLCRITCIEYVDVHQNDALKSSLRILHTTLIHLLQ